MTKIMKFRKFQQNKLWRDKAIELMEQTGSKISWTKLDDQAFAKEIKIKFMEEASEVCNAKSSQALLEEFADIMEVMAAWCQLYGYNVDDVIKIQQKKFQERGGFYGRKFVTVAQHLQGSFGEKYCLADPTKYPEIKE